MTESTKSLTSHKTISSKDKQILNPIARYKEIWQFKSFLFNWTKRELELRYKGSILGVIWSLLNPLLSLLVYFFVFKRLSGTTIPNFLVYLFSGVVAWMLCLQVLSKAPALLKTSSKIMSRVYFPLEILVISNVVSNLVNFFIAYTLVIAVVIISGAPLSWNILWVPVIALIQGIFLYATSMLLSSLGTIVRDTELIVNSTLSLLFFSTPILYKPELITSNKIALAILSYHPIAAIISLYRDVIHEATHPNWKVLLFVSLFVVIWYYFCHFVFHKLRGLIYDLI